MLVQWKRQNKLHPVALHVRHDLVVGACVGIVMGRYDRMCFGCIGVSGLVGYASISIVVCVCP